MDFIVENATTTGQYTYPVNSKKCSSPNCKYSVSGMPEYKFCPIFGSKFKEPKKTLYCKKKTLGEFGSYEENDLLIVDDVKEALKEYFKKLKYEFELMLLDQDSCKLPSEQGFHKNSNTMVNIHSYWNYIEEILEDKKSAKEVFGSELIEDNEQAKRQELVE